MDLDAIDLLVLDVDGVLTAGRVTFDDRDGQIISFNIRDGLAVKLWQHVGHRAAILSGRRSSIVERRARELGIDAVRQGVADKRAELSALLRELEASPRSACYVGDDLPDIEAMNDCGFGVAVANATAALKRHADYVTVRRGGGGAVAEVIELILRKQKRWTNPRWPVH